MVQVENGELSELGVQARTLETRALQADRVVEGLGKARWRLLADVNAITAGKRCVDRGHGVSIPDLGSLAELPEDASQAQGGSEGISVRTAMSRQEEALSVA